MNTNLYLVLCRFFARPFSRLIRTAALMIIAVSVLLTACTPPAPREEQVDIPYPAIRAVSWNIQWFPGRAPNAAEEEQERHRKEVRAYLPTLKPDILILQEIRDEEAAQFLVDSVDGLELHVATAFRRPWGALSQQIVIASRYPARAGFAEVFTDIYSSPEEEPHRGFAFAALESPLGGTLLVYGVHLKSNLGEPADNIAIREESARQIMRHVDDMKEQFAEYGPIAVIVGGDFNLLLEREEMAHERTLDLFIEQGFHSSWEGVPFEKRVTWPSMGSYKDACFDYILTYGLPELTAILMYKPAFKLSDHRPVLLPIPLPETEEE